MSSPWTTKEAFISSGAAAPDAPSSLMTSSARLCEPPLRSWAIVSTTKNCRVSSQAIAPQR
jgi:hypothetical protein